MTSDARRSEASSAAAAGADVDADGTAAGAAAGGGDGSLLHARLRIAVLVVLALLVASTPLWSTTSAARVVVNALLLVAVTQLWSYLAGAGGIVSLGVNGFAAVGGYGLWYLAGRGVNPVLAVGGAALAAAVVAALAAPLVLRLPAGLAAVASWAVGQTVLEILVHTGRLGGDAAVRPIDAVVDLGSARDGVVSWLAVVLGVAAVAIVYAHRRSMGGLVLVAQGDEAGTARALELPVRRARRLIWLLAGAVTGTAGALVAFRSAQIAPSAYDASHWTLPALAVAGIGGVGTLEGPLLAAVLYVIGDELFPGSGGGFAVCAALLGVLGLLAGADGWWGSLRRHLPVPTLPVRRFRR